MHTGLGYLPRCCYARSPGLVFCRAYAKKAKTKGLVKDESLTGQKKESVPGLASCRTDAKKTKTKDLVKDKSAAGETDKKEGPNKGTDSKSTHTRSHIDEFFRQYPAFDHQPEKAIMEEFRRMVEQLHLRDDDLEVVHPRLKSAMVLDFNDFFGTDAHDLPSWWGLCGLLEIDPIPNTVDECHKKVKQIHVNIVDLLEARRRGQEIRKFPSLAALRKYTKEEGKFFPREDAKAGGVLVGLLQHMSDPPRHLNHRRWLCSQTKPDFSKRSSSAVIRGLRIFLNILSYHFTNDRSAKSGHSDHEYRVDHPEHAAMIRFVSTTWENPVLMSSEKNNTR
ncbi:unnamed protein product [Somion occarium]